MTNFANMRWSRREFGLFTGAALLATTAGCASEVPDDAAEDAAAPAAGTLSSVGIQLWTIRDTFSADPLAALQAVADSGYAEVEFGGGGYFERDPAELAGFLEQTGLAAPSMHCSTDELGQQMDRVIAMAEAIGAKHVVLPATPEEMRGSVEAWTEVGALCTKAATQLSDEGIAFAYHNHDWEFAEVEDGVTGLDVIMRESDPELVKMELDFFWAITGGQDIGALIEQYAGRITLCHIKDRLPDGTMTMPGEGDIDYAAILKQAEKAGLQHFFVEDDSLVTVDKARMSAASAYLKGMEIS